MSKFLKGLCAVCVAVVGISYALPSSAQLISPFGKDAIALTEAESGMIRQSLRDVLEAYELGTVSSWKSDETNRAGEAVLIETFERDGMRCAEITHRFTAGKGRTYTAPVCRIESGEWKLAF